MPCADERPSCAWPPPPADAREWGKRALAFLALALAATVFFFPTPGGQLGLALAALLAALVCAVMELLTKTPPESEGSVTSRGRR